MPESVGREAYEHVMAVYDEESNQERWLGSKAFISLYLQDLQEIWAWGTRENTATLGYKQTTGFGGWEKI